MPNRRPKRPIAALFVAGRSIYRHMEGVRCYGARENALTFNLPIPLVAHPPCRTWSKNLRHQAKPLDLLAEQNLGRWAVEVVMKNGGVLEQPAESYLWPACQLPGTNDHSDPFCYTLQVEQSWWGHFSRKKTWLLICGVPRHSLPKIPFRFAGHANSTGWGCKEQRSATPAPFAEWLCQVARSVWWREGERL